jgi:hypothetical protein
MSLTFILLYAVPNINIVSTSHIHLLKLELDRETWPKDVAMLALLTIIK